MAPSSTLEDHETAPKFFFLVCLAVAVEISAPQQQDGTWTGKVLLPGCRAPPIQENPVHPHSIPLPEMGGSAGQYHSAAGREMGPGPARPKKAATTPSPATEVCSICSFFTPPPYAPLGKPHYWRVCFRTIQWTHRRTMHVGQYSSLIRMPASPQLQHDQAHTTRFGFFLASVSYRASCPFVWTGPWHCYMEGCQKVAMHPSQSVPWRDWGLQERNVAIP